MVNGFRPSGVPIIGNKDLLRNPQCAACEVSACSDLLDVNAPHGCAPIQPNTARLGHQIRCMCASFAWLEAQQDPFLDRSSWCCVVASVARLMPGHPIAPELPVTLKTSSRDGTTPSRPHMRHGVGNGRTRPDRQNAEIASET